MSETSPIESSSSHVRVRYCERCDDEARVHVLEGYVDGKPVHRHLCSECASTAYEQHIKSGAGHPRSRVSVGGLLITAGLLLLALGITADWFGFKGSSGFGWIQQAGLLIGILGIIVGALLRIDLLVLGGTMLAAGAALADIQGAFGSPGLGSRQLALILVGTVCVLIGLVRRRHRSRLSPIINK